MKTYTYSLLLAAAATGMAFGQTAYTKPVGYSSQALGAGFNVAGLTLQNPAVASGNFETVAGTTLTDTGVTFAPVAGRLYVLEITSGTLAGSIQEVPAASISGNTITTPQNLQTSGLVVGDTYSLRVAPTLEEIFTTIPLGQPGGVLASALSVGSSDVIWLPTGTGGFDKYYLRTGGTPAVSAFRSTPANVNTPNVPVVYVDGILIEKKDGTAATLTVSGEVKTQGSNSTLTFGSNLVSIVAPVGLNLFNAGLEDNLDAALSAGSADEVWVQQPNKSFTKYFRRSGTGAGWRVSGTTVTLTQAEAEAVVLPNSLIIAKKNAGTVPLTLNVPASYSGL
jgi:hypothetical protein